MLIWTLYRGETRRVNWGGSEYSYIRSALRISFRLQKAIARTKEIRRAEPNIWIFTPPNYCASFAPDIIFTLLNDLDLFCTNIMILLI